ncbi:hypothetical protein L596_019479 [Steinernema carpocapsae]|uniref:7TM GPCR serpentine receptor class x (Srx) domain-containing protein n=1 Tax=Steinernema carpocapsae TaxID=34508 RepID=A0A4U5MQQ5_STECR|nr:hypothetical protein L596_019479 [Steinernema carpocapsae]
MAFLGVIECSAILINSFLTGYFFLVGATFCCYPALMYFSGQLLNAFWEAQCMLCVLLGINRLVDFWNIPLFTWLFEGRMTFLWFVPVILGCAYFIVCTQPPLFNSIKQQWFFDPYAGMDVTRNSGDYTNIANYYSNFVTVGLLIFIYGTLILSLYWKSRSSVNSVITQVQKTVIIQAIVICFLINLGGNLFIALQILPVPNFLVVASLIGYQLSCGAGGIVYLIINGTIRKKVFKMMHIVKPVRSNVVVQRSATNHTRSTQAR